MTASRSTPGSGEVGRLARKGHVPIGYYKDEAKTKATFLEVDGERWVLPGDNATVDADGTVVLLGRGSTSINTGGEKVYPEEVETALMTLARRGRRRSSSACPTSGGASGSSQSSRPRRARRPSSTRCGRTPAPRSPGFKLPRELVVVDAVERTPGRQGRLRVGPRAAAEAERRRPVPP